ncbi:MAG: acetate/propionate family kinase [Verrucomicrobia bacterium]|nr:acetate/propionate family kinase [Cytophagales bacterium]
MKILVINCGSSSVKADLLDTATSQNLFSCKIDRISDKNPLLSFSDTSEKVLLPESGYEKSLSAAFEHMKNKAVFSDLKGIGHRIVHGGSQMSEPVIIDAMVEQEIERLFILAPLHNPVNLTGVRLAKQFFPDIPHVAVFDTAFHHTLPKRASLYALPKHLTDKHLLKRYGFHGTSHAYVAGKAAEYLQANLRDLRLITCHLGNGASVCAIEYGRSVETSMGMTPLEGLVMGTRSGDMDAGILFHLAAQENLDIEALNNLLNKESGLLGLTNGLSNDMRDIEKRAAEGDENCREAINIFSHRLRKYIGAYAAVMGGVDAIVFTAGIGENSATIRHRVSQRLEFLGAILDEDENREIQVSDNQPVMDISARHSRCKILVIATDEELAIARLSAKEILENRHLDGKKAIPIAVSARHVHLTQETVEELFGAGYQLTVRNPLSQPGQFACNETVTLVGPKNKLEKVRILGPVRSKNQVEISRTDEFFLGIDAPVRESGHTENSPGLTLIGSENHKVTLKEGAICAWRHIHMHPDDAEIFGVADKDIVEVEVNNSERSLIFGDVLIRVSDKFKLEMHIDTDEANAAEINSGFIGELHETDASGSLRKKKLN